SGRDNRRLRDAVEALDADARERGRIAILVGREIDRPAIGRERARERTGRIVRSDDGLSVRCEIDDIQIVVTATAQTIDQRECAVAADVLQPLQSVVARNPLSLPASGM